MIHDIQSLFFAKVDHIYKLFLMKNSFIYNRFMEENCCVYGIVIYYVYSITTANIILPISTGVRQHFLYFIDNRY